MRSRTPPSSSPSRSGRARPASAYLNTRRLPDYRLVPPSADSASRLRRATTFLTACPSTGIATRPASSGCEAVGSQWSRRRARRSAGAPSAHPRCRICCSGRARGPAGRTTNSARTVDGELPPRRARHASRRGDAGRAELRQRHRRAAAPRLAGTATPGPVAAGSGRLPGADGPGRPRQAVDRDAYAAHLGHPAGADAQ